ncbi:MAG: TatD family hydrolase [Candidatus Parvarchaeota archaeon]|jgi:Mg-dependent DNase|nr:TatD family hydrolase [Candidatus Parvarchaeota archaeon]
MEDKFIDVHAHISDRSLEKIRNNFLESISNSYLILNSGENKDDSERILKDSKMYPFLLPCIGLHPNEIAYKSYKIIQEEFDFFSRNIGQFFAVSEIGLDYKSKDIYQIEQEKEFLYRILEQAEKNNKVCIIHSRKAIEDVFDVVSSFNIKVILHNFEGNLRNLNRAQELGINISISTGFMKFKKENIIKNVNVDKLFTETDSPALSPDSNINTPLNIPKLLNYISSIKKMEAEQIKSIVYKNFRRLFYD